MLESAVSKAFDAKREWLRAALYDGYESVEAALYV